ncbi:XkdW family protein [Paenibacillus sp. HJGM_3]|uniref:XkdW family protein n=1 Tax=Paenibacillus sp. HJGM_3 TaxID=3379816 RepID=UPI003859F8F6
MNKAHAIMHLFPGTNPFSGDFEVRDDGDGIQYIHAWNINAPQPSEADLQAAWDDLQANPTTPPLTLEDKVTLLEASNLLLQEEKTALEQRLQATEGAILFLMDMT